MTEEQWKNFVMLATQLERETPIEGGIASRERLAVLAAYRELKQRREDEEWLFKSGYCATRVSGAWSILRGGSTHDVVSEAPTLHAAVEKARAK